MIGLYDYVETENGLYLIIELVDGKPIDDYINKIFHIEKNIFNFERNSKTEYFSNPKYQSCTFEEAVEDYNKMCPE